MTVTELKEYLTAGRHVHLIGIGGVSMFPLAEVLKGAGLVVTGSDIHENDNVDHLIARASTSIWATARKTFRAQS